MKRCLLGCGLIVWNVDLHADAMHPETRTGGFPPAEPLTTDWDAWYTIENARKRFIEENFASIVL